MSSADQTPPTPQSHSISSSRPLRVAALIKQVPAAENLSLGDDGRLDRHGEEQEMNPYCRRAVSKGTELAKATGGSVVIFTLGPPSAEDVLREAVAWGADEAVHLCDTAFAGSDTLATSRALSAAVNREGPFDLIIVGRNTIDGDTGQVGPEVAQLLGLPFAGGVHDLSLEGNVLELRLEHDDGWSDVLVTLPAVISVAERLTEPAKVPPAGRAEVPAEKIRRLAASDLGPGPWGQAGSATIVGDVYLHSHQRAGQVMTGTMDEQVGKAVALLVERECFESRSGSSDTPPQAAIDADRSDRVANADRAVVVIIEPERDSVAAELIGEANRIAGEVDAKVVVFRPQGAGVADLGALGADEVVDLEGDPLPHDVADHFSNWAQIEQPWLVLVPSTAFGREVAGRVAAFLGAGLVGDAIGLRVVGDRVVAAKPAFAGAMVADITCTSPVQMVTVRPGVLTPTVPGQRSATVCKQNLKATDSVRVLASTRNDDVEVLARAGSVVGVGMGLDPSHYGELQGLCGVLEAELAATRKVTDKGWMPRARQVGLTGRSISPRLFVSLGSSGKFNHMVGVQQAETVLAINSDPDALVFGHADIGIIGDWRKVVPLLADAISKRMINGA